MIAVIDASEHVRGLAKQSGELIDMLALFANDLLAFRAWFQECVPGSKVFVAFPKTWEVADRFHCTPLEDVLNALSTAMPDFQSVARGSGAIALQAREGSSLDVLATMAEQYRDRRVVLVSPNRILKQCLRAGSVSMLRRWTRDRGLVLSEKCEFYTEANLQQTFGFGHERWIDFLCLVGDFELHAPGVSGIDSATAAQWLKKYTLQEIIADVRRVHPSDEQLTSFAAFVDRLPRLQKVFTLNTQTEIVEVRS